MSECACGCGREAGAGQRGLSHVCYMRLYRAGGLALLDAQYPRKRPGPVPSLREALKALKVVRRG